MLQFTHPPSFGNPLQNSQHPSPLNTSHRLLGHILAVHNMRLLEGAGVVPHIADIFHLDMRNRADYRENAQHLATDRRLARKAIPRESSLIIRKQEGAREVGNKNEVASPGNTPRVLCVVRS